MFLPPGPWMKMSDLLTVDFYGFDGDISLDDIAIQAPLTKFV